MERRNLPETEENETGEKRRAEIENPEAAEINHEPENAGEASALAMAEPGGVDFHHAGRAERLQVAVDPANGDEQPEQSPEGREPEERDS